MPFTRIPDVVRRRAISVGAEAWVDRLPALVAQLEVEWEIEVGRVLDGGSEAFVAEATRRDGSDAILKLLIGALEHSAEHEVAVLKLDGGRGCAQLLNADVDRGAMLLERLGMPLSDAGPTREERLEVLCHTAQRIWRPAQGMGFTTGAEKAGWLMEFLEREWRALGEPCSRLAVKYALRCTERRGAAHRDERSVLVHGDIHDHNALAAPEGGYRLIDPDGLLAEPEYDLGVIIREERVDPGDPLYFARRAAERTGKSEVATWEWACAERLSTALVCRKLDLHEFASGLFTSAEVAARSA